MIIETKNLSLSTCMCQITKFLCIPDVYCVHSHSLCMMCLLVSVEISSDIQVLPHQNDISQTSCYSTQSSYIDTELTRLCADHEISNDTQPYQYKYLQLLFVAATSFVNPQTPSCQANALTSRSWLVVIINRSCSLLAFYFHYVQLCNEVTASSH